MDKNRHMRFLVEKVNISLPTAKMTNIMYTWYNIFSLSQGSTLNNFGAGRFSGSVRGGETKIIGRGATQVLQ